MNSFKLYTFINIINYYIFILGPINKEGGGCYYSGRMPVVFGQKGGMYKGLVVTWFGYLNISG